MDWNVLNRLFCRVSSQYHETKGFNADKTAFLSQSVVGLDGYSTIPDRSVGERLR